MAEDVIDNLNRSAKIFVDNGDAATLEEAMARLRGFRMHLALGGEAGESVTHQAALLTALNCGRRTFLGGVTVSGALDAPLIQSLLPVATLAEAVRYLGGEIVAEIPADVPIVSIGTPSMPVSSAFAIRTTFDGWRAGIVPVAAEGLAEAAEFALSGVLGGALAVAEVFAHLNGDAMAGHRTTGLSLWDQGGAADWRLPISDGPLPTALPADFWVIGLGHLGQAFLWSIGCLHYRDPATVRLFLQDVDAAGRSTPSTSILTFARDQHRLKTRICADWAEGRGFRTRLIERRFGEDLRVEAGEPLLALCGVDNPQARATLERAGFATIFEAGLGSGVEDFRLIRTHSFPGPVKASQIWRDEEQEEGDAVPGERPPAYDDLKQRGDLDECGLTRLADVAVGAPFVGTVAAALLIAQAVRMVLDGVRPTVANIDLRALQHRSVVQRDGADIVLFGTAAPGQGAAPSDSLSTGVAARCVWVRS